MSAAAPAREMPARASASRASTGRASTGRGSAAAGSRPVAARQPLRVVAQRSLPAGPLPFALLVSGVLGAGLVVLLMLHTLAAQDAFTVHKLQRQAAALGDVEQQLSVANQQAQAPSALAARARALGMVPTGSLQVVRHRDGRIVAVASAVPAPAPAPKAATSPQAVVVKAGSTTGSSASASPQPTTSAGATKPATRPAKRRHAH